MAKVYTTKNGRRYILKANGQAKFIKGKSRSKRGRSNMAKSKRIYSRAKSMVSGQTGQILGAMLYGASREKISNALAPLTNKIPLGDIADEVGIGLTAILAKKYLGRKFPMVRPFADAAITIEAARIGQSIASGNIMGTSSAPSNVLSVY